MTPGTAGSDRSLRERIAAVDWKHVARELDARGHARIPRLLRAAECRALRSLYARDELFRSRIDMERHGFGVGEYRYFANPLPAPVATLRCAAYPHLARIADGWCERLGSPVRHPGSLRGFLARCREAGQTKPTPLLLRYGAGGYNRLHQDLYGEVAFPLQIAVQLSRPERDFTGGEFLLLEQRPRMQSRGEAIALGLGEAIVFPNRERPVAGRRGSYRAPMRHGVSRIRSGERTTLGIIFHDAR